MNKYYPDETEQTTEDNNFVKAYIRRMLGNDIADYHVGQWDDETEDYYLDGKRVEYGRPDWSASRNVSLTSSQIGNALNINPNPTNLYDFRWDPNRKTFYKTNEYEMLKDINTLNKKRY